MTKTLEIPELFTLEGINVETMDGWERPYLRAHRGPYLWRTGDPEASMWHHTATPAYTPNRIKANMYAGLMHPGSQRLYQSGGGTPTIVIANAHPGPITSGYGQKHVLELARADEPNSALATGPDDDWAGNKSYWNTEVVLDGVGSWVDTEVWDMICVAGAVIHRLMGWSEWRAIGHGQHTQRKVDLWSGEDAGTEQTMMRFRADLATELYKEEDGMATKEEFVKMIRYADIDKMAADGIITTNEAKYFKFDAPWPGEDESLPKDEDHADWENLYLAWKVRAPIWAV